jgi:transcriptional regulator with XRE-family HTH domain
MDKQIKSKQNDISKRILSKMKEKGITLYQIEKQSGLYAGTLDKSLKAKSSWRSAVNLFTVSKILEVSLEYLITGIEPDKNKQAFNEKEETKKLCKTINELQSIIRKKEEKLKALKKII